MEFEKILEELDFNLESKFNHLEFEKYTAIELHQILNNIIFDEIEKIKISII